MNYGQLVDHWKTPSAAAEALGVDRRRVDDWKKRRIPSKWQVKAAALSGGKLKADKKAQSEVAELAQYVAAQQPGAAPAATR